MSGTGTKNTATITENVAFAKEKKGFPYKKVFLSLLIVLVVLLTLVLIVNIIINSYFSKIKVFDGVWELDVEKMNNMPMYKDNVAYFSQNDELLNAYHKALLNHAQATSNMQYDDDVYNYAVLGIDQFEGSERDPSADIIMLISINKDKEQVTYLSFETRMLVYIPQVGVGPMNDAYVLGGPQLLANTLEQNCGIQLDGFVEVNMTAFSELIGVFGKIEIAGDADLVDRINNDIALFNESEGLTGDDAVQNVELKKDKILLEGEQAIAYMRNADENKSSIANTILSQITAKIAEQGFGGFMTALDVVLDRMMVSMIRDDAGALITLGISVLESVKTTPVGNMEGRQKVGSVGYICDYQSEREAVIAALY